MEDSSNNSQSQPQCQLSKKIIIVSLIISFVALVLTATLTYWLTSNQHLDQQERQNIQIRNLQNALRKSNNLPPLNEVL